jgi:hypothetical protein
MILQFIIVLEELLWHDYSIIILVAVVVAGNNRNSKIMIIIVIKEARISRYY